MAWRSSGPTNAALIANLHHNALLTSPRALSALSAVDRAHFAPHRPYDDAPQSIGHRATISAPHMHAAALESLEPFLRPGMKALDVGAGSGFLACVMGGLVGGSIDGDGDGGGGGGGDGDGGNSGGGDKGEEKKKKKKSQGLVIGLEHIPALVDLAVANTSKSALGRELLASGVVRFVQGDGRRGWEAEAPYDAIHVGAAAAVGHREKLVEQLRAPGRMFIPVVEEEEEGGAQFIWVVDKDGQGRVTRKREFGVRYVPLTDAPVGG